MFGSQTMDPNRFLNSSHGTDQSGDCSQEIGEVCTKSTFDRAHQDRECSWTSFKQEPAVLQNILP